MHRLANTSKRSTSPLDPPVISSQPDGANTQHITLYEGGEREEGEEGRGEGEEGRGEREEGRGEGEERRGGGEERRGEERRGEERERRGGGEGEERGRRGEERRGEGEEGRKYCHLYKMQVSVHLQCAHLSVCLYIRRCVCGDGACLPLCPVSVATHCWEPTSQTLVLSSEEAVASRHPSREKQHHRTAPS